MRTARLLLTLVMGFSLSFFIPIIYAAVVLPSSISACVKKNGEIRIMAPKDKCDKNERFLEWNTQVPIASNQPSASSTTLGSFIGNDLSNKDLTTSAGVNFAYRNFENTNFSHSVLYAVIFSFANIKKANFTGTDLRSSTFDQTQVNGASFVSADFQSAWLNSDFSDIDFSNANMSHVLFNSSQVYRANFKNVNFSLANLSGVKGFSSANLNGAIWDNTVCPDGSNSLDNNSTCLGHLNP